MKKQKRSGSQNKKRKREGEENAARLRGSLNKYLIQNPSNSSVIDNSTNQELIEIAVENPSSRTHNPSSYEPLDVVIGKKRKYLIVIKIK